MANPSGDPPLPDTRPAELLEQLLHHPLSRPLGPDPDAESRVLTESVLAAIRATLDREVDGERWFYFRIPTAGAETPRLLAGALGSFLDDVRETDGYLGWWWLRKQDAEGAHLRLRVGLERSREEGPGRDELAEGLEKRLDREVVSVPYEPALSLFGGPEGVRLAHELFTLESDFLVRWFRTTGEIGAGSQLSGLSVFLAEHLMRSTGFDSLDRWEVWEWLWARRNAVPADELDVEAISGWADEAAAAGGRALAAALDDRREALVEDHLQELEAFGRRLHRASTRGRLTCGPRQFLGAATLYQWNRLELSYTLQARLARAMAASLSPDLPDGKPPSAAGKGGRR